MKALIKYIFRSWPWVIIVFGLLIVRAVGELALPLYTADIVNVGIQRSGIEYAIPEYLENGMYNKILAMSDKTGADKISSSYSEKSEKGKTFYKLNSSVDLSDKTQYDELFSALKIPCLALAAEVLAKTDNAMSSMLGMGGDLEMSIQEKLEMVKAIPEALLTQSLAFFAQYEAEQCGVDTEKLQKDYINKKGVQMLMLSAMIMVIMASVGFIAARVSAKTAANLRAETFKKVVSFSNAELDKFSVASLITRCTNDVQQVQTFILMAMSMVLYSPILGVGGVLRVRGTAPSMTWIIFTAVLAVIVLVGLLLIFAMPKFRQIQTKTDALTLVGREILTGLPVIRAFSREKHEEARFDKANVDLTSINLFVNRAMSVMFPMLMLIMNLIVLLIVWVGGNKIADGDIQVGDMMAFISYTMQIVMSFLMLTMISIMMPRAAVSAKRIEEILQTKASVVNKENTVSIDKIESSAIVFDNVSFHYPDGEDVLENISFEALPAQTTAIIGSTGSGKSSLINLIPRFYDPTSGKITVGGVDLRDLRMSELRDITGLVPQKAVLFSGTIDSNLRYGKPDAAAEIVQKAVEIAQAKNFISEKESGYDELIAQGGANVSGGQKQRLSIARAIVKEPKIYIFDDSFSALDYKTDATLRRALKEYVGGATVIIVAQRINTVLNAEKIVVLDEGKIAGIGSHKELLQSCEVYKQIASSQLSPEELENL